MTFALLANVASLPVTPVPAAGAAPAAIKGGQAVAHWSTQVDLSAAVSFVKM
jgi:hypothetical protein